MRRKVLSVLLPWLEVASAAVLGFVLYFPLGKSDLGEIAWIVAAIVGLSRLAITTEIHQELRPIRELAEVLDLRLSNHETRVRELVSLNDRIIDPELQKLRAEIVVEASHQLRQLAETRTSDLLAPGAFYEWLSLMLNGGSKGTIVRAVSTMLESEWNSSPAEENFLSENVAAGKRGVVIERIFVVPEARLDDFFKSSVALRHRTTRGSKLAGFVITHEAFLAADPDLLHRLGEGFIVFGQRAALIDVTVPPDQARGQITLDPDRVSALIRSFDQARRHAKPVDAAAAARPGS